MQAPCLKGGAATLPQTPKSINVALHRRERERQYQSKHSKPLLMSPAHLPNHKSHGLVPTFLGMHRPYKHALHDAQDF